MKTMKRIFVCFSLFAISFALFPQSTFSVKGLCINTPAKQDVDDFVELIDKKLAPAGVNTLVLRIDYRYEYVSSRIADRDPLSEKDVKKIVNSCRKIKFA